MAQMSNIMLTQSYFITEGIISAPPPPQKNCNPSTTFSIHELKHAILINPSPQAKH
jgi:hypothetical protein